METTSSLDRHTLVQEYRRVLGSREHHLPLDTQAVVVLSGPPEKDSNGNMIREYSLETITRIAFAIDLVRRIAAAKSGSPIEETSIEQGPLLVLNGLTDQLLAMEHIALQSAIPREMIELVDCGKRGLGNTKTQCEAMRTDPRFKDFKHVTFVTTGYHVPRVERTAEKQIPKDVQYDVIPVPYEKFHFNKFLIRGEIRKIQEYAQKGDIAQIASRFEEEFIQRNRL